MRNRTVRPNATQRVPMTAVGSTGTPAWMAKWATHLFPAASNVSSASLVGTTRPALLTQIPAGRRAAGLPSRAASHRGLPGARLMARRVASR